MKATQLSLDMDYGISKEQGFLFVAMRYKK